MKTIIDKLDLTNENSYHSMKHQKKKDLLLLATKLIKKTPDAGNTKESHKSLLKNKNKKLVKRSKIIIQETKIIDNLIIIDIKSVTIEHPKTFHELSKTIRQNKKTSQVDNTGKNIY